MKLIAYSVIMFIAAVLALATAAPTSNAMTPYIDGLRGNPPPAAAAESCTQKKHHQSVTATATDAATVSTNIWTISTTTAGLTSNFVDEIAESPPAATPPTIGFRISYSYDYSDVPGNSIAAAPATLSSLHSGYNYAHAIYMTTTTATARNGTMMNWATSQFT